MTYFPIIDSDPCTQGKTLRDEYAMAALIGILSSHDAVAYNPLSPEEAAAGALFYADAMLAARKGGAS